MSKKLWGGRFKKGLDDSAIKLSYTLHLDKRFVQEDIKVNRAHAKALAKAGIFSQDEFDKVDTCLQTLSKEFETNEDALLGNDEDIHSCIERLVTERLGDLGKKLHTGKSRNDQVITDTRLYVKAASADVQEKLTDTMEALWQLASKHSEQVFPGFTHFQPALPVLFAHHILAYIEKFQRDVKRFQAAYDSANISALGAGAMAGNSYGLDRDLIANELGFSGLTQNSMDAVSDRDFLVEFCFASSLCMTHLSRLCEELIMWNSPTLGFIEIGDEFTTGSSIMPQKKNPDVAELIRGKTGRVLGDLVSILHTLKSLPLTYNRDLQEDKEGLYDAYDTVALCLENMAKMIPTISLNVEAIQDSMSKGYLLATDFADYLVQKGVPFRESHEVTGAVVLYAIENKKQLEELSLEEFHSFDSRIDKDVYDRLTLSAAINVKNVVGGTAITQVKGQLERLGEKFGWKKH
jgi:argininosuccinate lyase